MRRLILIGVRGSMLVRRCWWSVSGWSVIGEAGRGGPVVRPSFVPPRPFRELRDVTRYRALCRPGITD
jgi:hypothetical protein